MKDQPLSSNNESQETPSHLDISSVCVKHGSGTHQDHFIRSDHLSRESLDSVKSGTDEAQSRIKPVWHRIKQTFTKPDVNPFLTVDPIVNLYIYFHLHLYNTVKSEAAKYKYEI